MILYRVAPLTDDWETLGAVYIRAETEADAITYAVAHYDSERVTTAGFFVERLG